MRVSNPFFPQIEPHRSVDRLMSQRFCGAPAPPTSFLSTLTRMSRVRPTTIAHGLQGMAAGVERAQQAAAAADARAEEIVGRAMMGGFAGIAMGIQGVRSAIGEIRQRLAAVGPAINEAAAPVHGASGKPSPEETIALLNPANEQVGVIRDALAGLTGQVTQVQQQAGAVLQGGQPGAMVATLEQIKQVLGEVIGQSDTTRQALNVAIAQARHLGEQGN